MMRSLASRPECWLLPPDARKEGQHGKLELGVADQVWFGRLSKTRRLLLYIKRNVIVQRLDLCLD